MKKLIAAFLSLIFLISCATVDRSASLAVCSEKGFKFGMSNGSPR